MCPENRCYQVDNTESRAKAWSRNHAWGSGCHTTPHDLHQQRRFDTSNQYQDLAVLRANESLRYRVEDVCQSVEIRMRVYFVPLSLHYLVGFHLSEGFVSTFVVEMKTQTQQHISITVR